MKLIIQIPCYDEQSILARTVSELPRHVDDVDDVEVLVIDDGSSDATVQVASRAGVDHIFRHRRNRGLAAGFATGIDIALRLGADIIVNTDGDNQYPASAIEDLVRPILAGHGDLVIGDRQPWKNPHFSCGKRFLHWLGSRMVSYLAGQRIPDPVSGFRALSRDAALKLNVTTPFSYTIETVLQAAHKGLAIVSIPIETNSETRPSRLFRNVFEFLIRSTATMLRVYGMYHSLAVFVWTSLFLMVCGALPILRFLWLFANGNDGGHIQSLILGGVLFLCGSVALAFGVLADLISFNRRLLETTLEKVRRIELGQLNKRDASESKRRAPAEPRAIQDLGFEPVAQASAVTGAYDGSGE